MSAPAVLIATAKLGSGKEEDFNAWQARHNAVAHRFPGFISSTSEHLEAWMNSPERAELLRESKVFVAQEQLLRLATSFPGWVPINPLTGKGPPNWKTALLVILGDSQPLAPAALVKKQRHSLAGGGAKDFMTFSGRKSAT